MGWTNFRMPERALDTKYGRRDHNEWLDGAQTSSADRISEFPGRLCYDSFQLPNTSTATNRGYLANIIAQRHFSVMEHSSATFLIEDVSRSLLMEMRTHRHASFSARSTRYVDESDAAFVMPPALRGFVDDHLDSGDTHTVSGDVESLMEHATQLYESIAAFLVRQGATRKEAREAAREVLPGGTTTEFVMTANHHAWREILQKRLASGAAQEIRELSEELLDQLTQLAPNIYQDIKCP